MHLRQQLHVLYTFRFFHGTREAVNTSSSISSVNMSGEYVGASLLQVISFDIYLSSECKDGRKEYLEKHSNFLLRMQSCFTSAVESKGSLEK